MKISVIIPLFNKIKKIENTIRSVLNQTFTDFEIIVVNDGSTDGSDKLIRNICDARIKVINQTNSGVSVARNKGISQARGEYIALLDADDEWKPEFLTTINNMIKKYPECQVFATRFQLNDQNGNITNPKYNNFKIKEEGVLENYFEVACSSFAPICSSAIVIKKNAICAIGGFPVGIRLGEDLITWAKLACKFKIAYSQKPLAIYNLVSQEKRLVPVKKPNKIDYVGNELNKLIKEYDIPFLKRYAARWHKIRMVTFVQLQKRVDARSEYAIIKKLIIPGKKEKLWLLLSYMPISVVRFFLKYKDRLR